MSIFNKLFGSKENDVDEFEYFNANGKYQTRLYLDDILTPLINEKFSMKYDGRYTWYSEFVDHKRLVISLFLLKGDSAIIQWGYNFDFIPEIKSNKIQYYRTDKHIQAQLRDMPKEFIDCKDFKMYKIPLHANDLDKLRIKIETTFKALLPSIMEFFSKESTEDLLLLTEYQIEYKKYYKILSPEQQYIKAFLLARQGHIEKAVKQIKDTYVYQNASDDNKQKLMKKLNDCKEE